MRMRLVAVILLLVGILAIATANTALAAGEPDFGAMTEAQLRDYASQHDIDLGSAKTKAAMTAVIKDALAAEAEGNGDLPSLPSSSLFKPQMPDLSPGTVPAKALSLGRLLLGLFGLVIILVGLYHTLRLAMDAFSGKKSLSAIGQQLLVLGIGFTVVLIVLGGAMWDFFVAIYRFMAMSV